MQNAFLGAISSLAEPQKNTDQPQCKFNHLEPLAVFPLKRFSKTLHCCSSVLGSFGLRTIALMLESGGIDNRSTCQQHVAVRKLIKMATVVGLNTTQADAYHVLQADA